MEEISNIYVMHNIIKETLMSISLNIDLKTKPLILIISDKRVIERAQGTTLFSLFFFYGEPIYIYDPCIDEIYTTLALKWPILVPF